MSEDPTDNVVKFRADKPPSARLKHLDWTDKRARCDHRAVEVWAKEPILECSDCGAVVDPYEWIRSRCGDWDRLMDTLNWQRQEIKDEIKGLQAALRMIRGEYRNEQEKRETERAIMVLPKRRG